MKTVDQHVEEIKKHMPKTYECIKAKAALIGNDAFSYVRRGLRGEENCFWAMEAGWVKGNPFFNPDVQPIAAYNMVAFGTDFFVAWHEAAAVPTPPAN